MADKKTSVFGIYPSALQAEQAVEGDELHRAGEPGVAADLEVGADLVQPVADDGERLTGPLCGLELVQEALLRQRAVLAHRRRLLQLEHAGVVQEERVRVELRVREGGGLVPVRGRVERGRPVVVALRVLVPAVENSVAGNAFRPLDVVRSRKGLTVEIGNTDAEGRLILCDALAEACDEKPDLIVDCATLTGAARVALGPELPVVFSNHEGTAAALLRYGVEEDDPLWRLPLHRPYRRMLDSKVADINNVSESGYAGAITAALFLNEFVESAIPWVHIDMMAWNPSARPGRPEGGEAQGLRALYALVAEKAASAA